jgi:predicted NBD/HSP70 family sugar kinase/biotin operon repressor
MTTDLQYVPLASLDLLRQITDRHVIDQLLAAPAMTRADIAAATGISKPTISESVRRLEQSGLLVAAGEQTGRRGRAGTYYALPGSLGVALTLSAGPDGLVAEVFDIRGRPLHRLDRAIPSQVTAAQLDPLLRALVEEALARAAAPVRAAALSVAGPVDRATGRLVHLPNAPFLVDELDPHSLLDPVLESELIVDNDVNWAALAEHRDGAAAHLEDFCFLHLGHGLGGAYVRGGAPVRGHAGLAGEPAYMITVGPDGTALRLIDCFGALGLLRAGSAAIDVARVREALHGETAADRSIRDAVVAAVAGVVTSMAALLNPSGVVVGGPWSDAADFGARLAARVAETAVIPATLRLARLGPTAPLVGLRHAAVRAAQSTLLGPLAKELVA